MPDSSALTGVKNKLAQILDFPGYPEGGGGLLLVCGETPVFIRAYEEARPIVNVAACVAVELQRVTPELIRMLALESRNLRFGKFAFLEQGRQVTFIHCLLGERLHPATLTMIVNHVATVAEKAFEAVVRLGGGRRMRI